MPTYYDSNGNSYVLTQEIGRGGEGTVFYCPNDLALVAKIYHEPIDEEKAKKLRWMAANRNDGLLKIAAWIVDTLHDKPNGKTVGFVMPNVKAKEIHELYSLKSRRVHFPEATWQFLLHTATNVARAFYVLHKNDHVMGDVNHGNCVVLADGTVKLIDCDSYSIKTEELRYRCEVGVATHLAPELQGLDLSEVEREQKHDNFGLAVIIFQLLFLGRHPFSGNYLGAEDKSLEDCIRERRFAYGNQQVTNVKQPPGTLSLLQISPRLAGMFNAAFLTQNRPEPREWIEALEDLSNNLQQCGAHIGHYYFQQLTACPWCEIEAKTGLIIFPFVSSEAEKGFNIFTIENLLASVDIPTNLPAKPLKANVLPPPSAEIVVAYQENRNKFIGLVFIELFLVVTFSIAFATGCGFVFGIVMAVFFLVILNTILKDDKERLENELQYAREGWNYLEREWTENNKEQDFVLDVEVMRQKISVYQSLQLEKIEQIKQLGESSFEYQLRNYLSAHKLSDLQLRKNQQDALTRYGLLTAADVDEKRLQTLLAVDEKAKASVIEWRTELEKDFKFEPNVDLPVVAQNRLEIEFTEKYRKIEKEIEQLLATLRVGSTKMRHQQKLMMEKARTLSQKLLQSESDFGKINNSAYMSLSLLLIPILVPLAISTWQSYSVSPGLKPAKNIYGNTKTVPASNTFDSPIEYDYPVKENVTDAEIAKMGNFDREQSAKSLHKQAVDLIEKKDYKQAEKKLRLALRFVHDDVTILYSVADVLYNQKKYDESLAHLGKLLSINSNNENAKLLMGAIYLKLEKNDDAEEIFTKILENNPDSYEANFNLGGIYMKKRDYESAKYAFEKAIRTEPYNVDANYEYGVCLAKLGDWQNAKEQYDFLARNDEKKAAELWKVMNKIKPLPKKFSLVENTNAPTPPPSYARQ